MASTRRGFVAIHLFPPTDEEQALLQITVYMTGHMTSLSLQNTQILFDFLVVSG
jgi:hypothetical protein